MKRGQETNHIWKQEAGTQDTHDRGLTVASYLFKFLQKITIADLALLLQHLLTCNNNFYWSEFFKADRAECYMKLVREIVR